MINLSLIEKLNNENERSLLNLQFNCFGAAALYFGLVKTYSWMDYREMQLLIEQNMEEINENEATKNDLYALYDKVGLLHTAIYLGNSFWQKPGKWKAELTSKKFIDEAHIEKGGVLVPGCYTKFYRMKTY